MVRNCATHNICAKFGGGGGGGLMYLQGLQATKWWTTTDLHWDGTDH
jgi:hypothetical protein